MHTHLDKGHIWQRAPNPDGTFDGALAHGGRRDRAARWTSRGRAAADGVRPALPLTRTAPRDAHPSRLACARSPAITWPVVRRRSARSGPAGSSCRRCRSCRSRIFAQPRRASGWPTSWPTPAAVLGAVVTHAPDRSDAHARSRVHAGRRARARSRPACRRERRSGARRSRASRARPCATGFSGRVVVRALLHPGAAEHRRVRRADARSGGACRHRHRQPADVQPVPAGPGPGRTPRWRGVTLLHEMRARGIPVAVASDNCRDPFYGYGDHDMLEVFREAVRIVHLDRPFGAWPRRGTATPADMMGLADRRALRRGRARRPRAVQRPALERVAVAAAEPIASCYAPAAPSTPRCQTIASSTTSWARWTDERHARRGPTAQPKKVADTDSNDRHRRGHSRASRHHDHHRPGRRAREAKRLLLVQPGAQAAARRARSATSSSCRRARRRMSSRPRASAWRRACRSTLRGTGTGNYGQAMPLGAALHARLVEDEGAVKRLGPGWRAWAAGLQLVDIDHEARRQTSCSRRSAHAPSPTARRRPPSAASSPAAAGRCRLDHLRATFVTAATSLACASSTMEAAAPGARVARRRRAESRTTLTGRPG